jgi:hypothetical protein
MPKQNKQTKVAPQPTARATPPTIKRELAALGPAPLEPPPKRTRTPSAAVLMAKAPSAKAPSANPGRFVSTPTAKAKAMRVSSLFLAFVCLLFAYCLLVVYCFLRVSRVFLA